MEKETGIREKDMEKEILEKEKADPKEDAISVADHTTRLIVNHKVE